MTERTNFRYALGFLVVVGGLACLGGLYFVSVPNSNRDAVMLALGVVLGWGSAVVAFEFGSTSSGRSLAMANADIIKQGAQSPTGKPGDPVAVTEERKPS